MNINTQAAAHCKAIGKGPLKQQCPDLSHEQTTNASLTWRMQAAGQPGVAVQWGAWGGAGMALRVPGFLERMSRRGLGALHPAAGLAALWQALRSAVGPPERAAPVLVGAASPSVWCTSVSVAACCGVCSVCFCSMTHVVSLLLSQPYMWELHADISNCWRLQLLASLMLILDYIQRCNDQHYLSCEHCYWCMQATSSCGTSSQPRLASCLPSSRSLLGLLLLLDKKQHAHVQPWQCPCPLPHQALSLLTLRRYSACLLRLPAASLATRCCPACIPEPSRTPSACSNGFAVQIPLLDYFGTSMGLFVRTSNKTEEKHRLAFPGSESAARGLAGASGPAADGGRARLAGRAGPAQRRGRALCRGPARHAGHRQPYPGRARILHQRPPGRQQRARGRACDASGRAARFGRHQVKPLLTALSVTTKTYKKMRNQANVNLAKHALAKTCLDVTHADQHP